MFEMSSMSGMSKEAIVLVYFMMLSGAITIYVALKPKPSVNNHVDSDSDSEYDVTERIDTSSDSEDDMPEGSNLSDDINSSLYGKHAMSDDDNEEESRCVRKNNQKLISIHTDVLIKIKEKIGNGIQDLSEMNDTITRELSRLGLMTRTVNRELKARKYMGSFSTYSLDELYSLLKVKNECIETEHESRWMQLALEEIMRRRMLG